MFDNEGRMLLAVVGLGAGTENSLSFVIPLASLVRCVSIAFDLDSERYPISSGPIKLQEAF